MRGKADTPEGKAAINPVAVLKRIADRRFHALIYGDTAGMVLLTGHWMWAQTAPGLNMDRRHDFVLLIQGNFVVVGKIAPCQRAR